jgi:hypothetical protein
MQAASGEFTIFSENVSYFELHGKNQENKYTNLNGYRCIGEKNLKKTVEHLLIIN